MRLIGTPSDWVNLIDTLVPRILDFVITTWEGMPSPAPNAHEDHISEALCRSLCQNPNRAELPFQIRPQIVELDPAAGADQGRMDIVFILLVPHEGIYFCLECKRLNVARGTKIRPYSSEYVRYGMSRFIRGQYAPMVRHGGMLGYVLDGNVNQAIKNISGMVQRHYKALGMEPPGEMQPSSVRPRDPRVRETHHTRQYNTDPFQIHHVFVACALTGSMGAA